MRCLREERDEQELEKREILDVRGCNGNHGSWLQQGVISGRYGRQSRLDARRECLAAKNEASRRGNVGACTHGKNRSRAFREFLRVKDGEPDVYPEARQQDLYCV